MDLSSMTNEVLLERTERLARSERKITQVILWHVNEVECRRLYATLGYKSMHEYLVKHLKYSDNSAYQRHQSARLLKKIPHLAEKLEEGTLNLTQMVQVNTCLNKDKKLGIPVNLDKAVEVFEKIGTKNSFETQKVLAVEFNQAIQMHEVLKPQRDGSFRLELALSETQMNELKEVKDLLSHTLPNATWVEVISYLSQKQIQKIRGKTQVKRDSVVALEHKPQNEVIKSAGGLIEKVTPSFTATGIRKSIKITTRRQLLEKADHCCEFVDAKSGRRCEGTYQLQIDHRVPLALGGSNRESNLRVLCRTHNLLAAEELGLKWRPEREK